MSVRRKEDSDRPPKAGRLAVLHLQAGRALISTANFLRPRVTLGVRLVALDEAGRVFLVRHSYLPGFHLPGGGVESGETVRQAILREAAEEGGLICPEPPILFGVYLNLALARRDHVAVFLCRNVEARQGRAGGLEVVEKAFFPVDALPEQTTKATRARIEEVLFGRRQSETW